MEDLRLKIEELEERIAPGSFATELTLTAPSGTSTPVCGFASAANVSGQVTVA